MSASPVTVAMVCVMASSQIWGLLRTTTTDAITYGRCGSEEEAGSCSHHGVARGERNSDWEWVTADVIAHGACACVRMCMCVCVDVCACVSRRRVCECGSVRTLVVVGAPFCGHKG